MVKQPFPYFGGKSRVADEVWRRLGDVKNYVEPFCGGCGVLLNRPTNHQGYVETINDAWAFISNFWRAVKLAPNKLARFCDWPVNEIDLTARPPASTTFLAPKTEGGCWLVTPPRPRKRPRWTLPVPMV